LILGCLLALAALAVDMKQHWLSEATFLLRGAALLAGAVVLGIVVWTQFEARDHEGG